MIRIQYMFYSDLEVRLVLSDKELKIVEIIKEKQPISVYSLWKLSGYRSYSSVHTMVKLLLAKGEIKAEYLDREHKRLRMLGSGEGRVFR